MSTHYLTHSLPPSYLNTLKTPAKTPFRSLSSLCSFIEGGIIPILLDEIGGLFRDGIDAADDIAADVVCKDAGIGDAQALDAVDAQARVDGAAHGAGAARVVLADAVFLDGGAARRDRVEREACRVRLRALADFALHCGRLDQLLGEFDACC